MDAYVLRRWIFPGLLGAGLLLGAVASLPRGRDSETIPILVRGAEDRLAEARRVGAGVRAPLTLARAEEAYALGLVARRRQDLRPAPLRDYRAATELMGSAARWSVVAARIARDSRESARRQVEVELDRADGSLGPLEGLEEWIGLEHEVRARLHRARAWKLEAAALVRAGRLDAALERASMAMILSEELSVEIGQLFARYTDPAHTERWRRMVEETLEWSRSTGRAAVIVSKDEHRILLYEGGRLIRGYDADLGWNNLPDKAVESDRATPEGRYRITEKKSGSRTRYHRALLLDYPNPDDLAAFRTARREHRIAPGARPGGLIEIHGEGGRGRDWTDGCVALSNPDMDDLFARVSTGTPVTIVGTTEGRGRFSALARRLGR